MTITLENITVYIAILSFGCMLVNYLIISPLRVSIIALQTSIDRLDARLGILDEKMEQNKERLICVEASAKQAHKRIDRLDKIIDDTGGDDK